jgi:hypothetical protein
MRFGASFHLNETVHFGKNGVVSCISLEKKKKQKRCRFERHHVSSSSPGRAENRGRRSICPLLFSSLSLFPNTQKNPTKHPTCPNPNPWPTTRRKNRGDKPLWVAQWPPGHPLPLCHDCTGVVALSSPFPPYKYQGREMKGGGEEKRRRKEKQSRRV